MSHVLVYGIGILSGILISFAFPTPSMQVNQLLSPIVLDLAEKFIDFIADLPLLGELR